MIRVFGLLDFWSFWSCGFDLAGYCRVNKVDADDIVNFILYAVLDFQALKIASCLQTEQH